MRAVRLAVVFVLALAALGAALVAHDAFAWRSTFVHGDRRLATHPRSAAWKSPAWIPGDPLGTSLHVGGDVALRQAIRAYEIALATPRGYDEGATQAQVRAGAEVQLSNVAASRHADAAARAGVLLGVLVERGGNVAGGITADDRAQAAFTAAIERDPENRDAGYDLELLLRRTRARATRHGAGNGTGSKGRGHKGAGAGSPGRGY